MLETGKLSIIFVNNFVDNSPVSLLGQVIFGVDTDCIIFKQQINLEL